MDMDTLVLVGSDECFHNPLYQVMRINGWSLTTQKSVETNAIGSIAIIAVFNRPAIGGAGTWEILKLNPE